MVSKIFTIKNSDGLHMRPAAKIALEMGKYDCDTIIKYDGKNINAKSLINVVAACIKCGAVIEFQCDGMDEEEAMNKFIEMEANRFGE